MVDQTEQTPAPEDEDDAVAMAAAEADAEEAAEEADTDDADMDVDIPDAPADAAPDMMAQVQDLNDKLLRALADAENTRRRAERQVEDASKYAIANFARDMIGVADNLRRALDSLDADARQGNEALENLCAGIEMTERDMLATFDRVGVKPIETDGKRMDPNLHEAMFEVENPNVPAGTIIQVIRPGFTLGERLLRAAQVGVAKGGPKGVPDGPAEAEAYDGKGAAVGDDKGINLDENL